MNDDSDDDSNINMTGYQELRDTLQEENSNNERQAKMITRMLRNLMKKDEDVEHKIK
jgi:hypothetical protein